MEALRKLVSGNRKRYIDDYFSLDLTYITHNIIAMSYPSDGLESYYRNPIEKVSTTTESNKLRSIFNVNFCTSRWPISSTKSMETTTGS